MPPRKIGRLIASLVAGCTFAICIWYLAKHFEWREAFAYLLRTDFVRLIGLVWAAHFGYILLRTCRWWIVVRRANPDIKFGDLYWISAVVVSLAILTPGQLGEALKIELLKRRGLLARLPGLGAFALERVLDVLAIAGMGAIGVMFGSGLSQRYPWLRLGIGILIAIGLAALYLLLRFDPGGRASHWLARMRTGSGSPATWAKMAMLTFLSWGFIGVGWQIALLAVDVRLSLPEIIWLVSLVTLGTLVSLIPGGLGVAEVLTVQALANMGIAPVSAQAGALILRVYAVIIVLFGLAHLLLWPVCRLRARKLMR